MPPNKSPEKQFFLAIHLDIKIKEVPLHRFHGIRFKVSEDWLSRDNQFFLFQPTLKYS